MKYILDFQIESKIFIPPFYVTILRDLLGYKVALSLCFPTKGMYANLEQSLLMATVIHLQRGLWLG